MARRMASQIGQALLSLVFILLLVFCLVRFTGDPINFLLEPGATDAQKDALRERLHLDGSVISQFWAYLDQVAHGQLGISYVVQQPVTDLIMSRAEATLVMGAGAIALTIAIGLPLGLYAGYWRGRPFDSGVRGFSAVFQSLPDFWVGFMLIFLVAIQLKLLPAGGYGGIKQLILPSITLALPAVAGLARLLRSSVIEEMESDYVLFHRIKGTPEGTILWKHSLRNGGITTLSFLGIVTAGLFTGSVLVETIFNWPGLGLLLVTGIRQRDFAVVQGVTLVYALAYIITNLVVDLLYTYLNPRLKATT